MKHYTSQDLYAFTMKQAVWSQHPNAIVEYEFFCRNKDVDLLPYMSRIKEKIQEMHGLSPKKCEIECLSNLGFLKPGYLEALSQFKLDTRHINVFDRDGKLAIEAKGPWYNTIDFEVPVLRAVNEAYFEQYDTPSTREEGDRRLTQKIEQLKAVDEEYKELTQQGVRCHPFSLMEFGTRRAFSEEWQEHVVERLALEAPRSIFVGSSNVWAACKNGVKPQGTMAHQWPMAFQAFAPLHLSQKAAFDAWNQEFRGNLGIALSDTLGLKQFLRDFDLLLALAFAGPRQDSGDPYTWGNAILNHYRGFKIDPYTKTASWTNGLNLSEGADIWRAFRTDIKTNFGIGTFLTNDLGPKPLNIVMKMVKCDGVPLIKISDDPGKVTCQDEKLKDYAVHLFNEVL